MIEVAEIVCPWCGEPDSRWLDTSSGSAEYVEDCAVCCRPILFRLAVDPASGASSLATEREDG